YPSSSFIQLSNMYCTPTGKAGKSVSEALLSAEEYAKIPKNNGIDGEKRRILWPREGRRLRWPPQARGISSLPSRAGEAPFGVRSWRRVSPI
ncbi:MAG: hypothetical protein ACLUGG_00705, partial [Oscillospiraceae bacterium]